MVEKLPIGLPANPSTGQPTGTDPLRCCPAVKYGFHQGMAYTSASLPDRRRFGKCLQDKLPINILIEIYSFFYIN